MKSRALDGQTDYLRNTFKTVYSDTVDAPNNSRTVTIDVTDSAGLRGTWSLVFTWRSLTKTYRKSTTLCIYTLDWEAECPGFLPCNVPDPCLSDIQFGADENILYTIGTNVVMPINLLASFISDPTCSFNLNYALELDDGSAAPAFI